MESDPLAFATRDELLDELARRSHSCFLVAAGKDTDGEPWAALRVQGTVPHVNTLIQYGVAETNENRTD